MIFSHLASDIAVKQYAFVLVATVRVAARYILRNTVRGAIPGAGELVVPTTGIAGGPGHTYTLSEDEAAI